MRGTTVYIAYIQLPRQHMVYSSRPMAHAQPRKSRARGQPPPATPRRYYAHYPQKYAWLKNDDTTMKKDPRGGLKKKKQNRLYIILQVILTHSRPIPLHPPSDPRFGQTHYLRHKSAFSADYFFAYFTLFRQNILNQNARKT